MTKKQTSHPLKDGEINILRANVNVNYTHLVHVEMKRQRETNMHKLVPFVATSTSFTDISRS